MRVQDATKIDLYVDNWHAWDGAGLVGRPA
jgi:hypothetical protein